MISIHAPREGSDGRLAGLQMAFTISIHAPREGSDVIHDVLYRELKISIHAPREGSDGRCRRYFHRLHNFNPRSPGGERPLDLRDNVAIERFQSTLPGRGATAKQHKRHA